MPDASNLKELIGMLAPGLIILTIRSWFMAGPRPDLKDRLLSYTVVSAIYFALVTPALSAFRPRLLSAAAADLIEYGILPVAVGAIFAIGTQQEWPRRFWGLLRMNPVHNVPTAWDYMFSRITQGTFVLVTLTNDAQVAGLFGPQSFASSNREERDLLIEEIWEIADDGTWTRADPRKSVLLCGRDIRHVEVY